MHPNETMKHKKIAHEPKRVKKDTREAAHDDPKITCTCEQPSEEHPHGLGCPLHINPNTGVYYPHRHE